MATFATLQTYVGNWLNRSDLSTEIKLFLNIALRKIESDPYHNWKYMRANTSSTLSDGDYTISYPTRYKATQALFVLDTDNRYRRLDVTSLSNGLEEYPYLSDNKAFPDCFSPDDANSQVILRPTVDQTYTYQWYFYQFSAELSADGDTNWLTNNFWELLLYGALFEAAVFMKDEDEMATFKSLYDERFKTLADTQTDQDWMGAPPMVGSEYVV